ncbi:alpha/beta hydrolase family protein [Microbulbifer sp. DLAB2-AF]|uniref:alpha/beta hydrolase family protein n=1 Tax=Microbulbifer sp. DLAB2-AF TaxID=3243395 RepID=UPI004039326C
MKTIKTKFRVTKWRLKSLILATLLTSNAMATDIEGDWRSMLKTNDEKIIPIVVQLEENSGEWTGVLNSPSLEEMKLGITGLDVIDNRIAFEVEALDIKYEGSYINQVDLIAGANIKKGASSLTFFSRINDHIDGSSNHSQTQKKPIPYIIEDVNFKNKETSNLISGTLTRPASRIKATAVLISGSGPQDRDESLFGHKPFAVIADHLTRQGYAVLRYDDRGVGGSSGSYQTATTKDFASDTSAAVDYLNSRNDLPQGKTGLIGHSEGGMIAPMVASRRDDIAFAILLAGPAVKIPNLLVDQWYRGRKFNGLSEEILNKLKELDKEILEKIGNLELNEPLNDTIQDLIYSSIRLEGVPEEDINTQFEEVKKEYSTLIFRDFIRFNPEFYLEQTKAPLLALNGSLDFQVDAKMNLGNIQSVLNRVKHKDFTVIELDRMNHLFQVANSGSFNEYAELEEGFSPKALLVITKWLNERFKI